MPRIDVLTEGVALPGSEKRRLGETLAPDAGFEASLHSPARATPSVTNT
jgi:hypothetical protein